MKHALLNRVGRKGLVTFEWTLEIGQGTSNNDKQKEQEVNGPHAKVMSGGRRFERRAKCVEYGEPGESVGWRWVGRGESEEMDNWEERKLYWGQVYMTLYKYQHLLWGRWEASEEF